MKNEMTRRRRRRVQFVNSITWFAMLWLIRFRESLRRRVVGKGERRRLLAPETIDVAIDFVRHRFGQIDARDEVTIGGELAKIRRLFLVDFATALFLGDRSRGARFIEPDESRIFLTTEK